MIGSCCWSCGKKPEWWIGWMGDWSRFNVLPNHRKKGAYHTWLVISTPLKNISQWEGFSNILWKITNLPNHQPYIYIYILYILYIYYTYIIYIYYTHILYTYNNIFIWFRIPNKTIQYHQHQPFISPAANRTSNVGVQSTGRPPCRPWRRARTGSTCSAAGQRRKDSWWHFLGWQIACSYGHLSVITGYKWDYTFYKWGYKYL